MAWVDAYEFEGPLADLRGDGSQAADLEAELCREVARGHTLYGRTVRVVARAWPNDDVVIVCDDDAAVVHLTWTGRRERPPWPLVTPLGSADDLAAHVAAYDWEP